MRFGEIFEMKKVGEYKPRENGQERSPDYHSTVDHRTAEGQAHIATIRDHVKTFNKSAKALNSPARATFQLHYRLGKNSPHASKYAGLRGNQVRIPAEDATRADLYVRHRKQGNYY